LSSRRPAADPIPPEAFLAGYPDDIRAMAEILRGVVRRAVPDAVERVRSGWRLIGFDLRHESIGHQHGQIEIAQPVGRPFRLDELLDVGMRAHSGARLRCQSVERS